MKAREIAEFVGGELFGDDIEITSVADIKTASSGQISFFEKDESLPGTNASCLLVPRGSGHTGTATTIAVKNPKLAFARIAARLHPPKHREAEIHPSSIIAENAQLGENVFVGAFACVGEGASIGDGTHLRAGAKIGDSVHVGRNCVVHANVLIEDGSEIGNNVILHAGVVIGADGFGYVRDDAGYYIK